MTHEERRFIPAYAGNSQIVIVNDIDIGGSSPLTRGTLSPGFKNCVGNRFIPAYAGNSIKELKKEGLKSVHPRLRGELV